MESPRLTFRDAMRVVYVDGTEWVQLALCAVALIALSTFSDLPRFAVIWPRIVAAVLIAVPFATGVGLWVAVKRANRSRSTPTTSKEGR